MRNSLSLGLVFFSLIFLAGCGTLETLVNKDGSAATTLGDFIGGDKTAALPAVSAANTAPAPASAESMSITLFFADSTGKYLVKEQRSLSRTVSLARETVNQWLKGPGKGTAVQAAVPTTTTLLDIALKDNVAIVDLSKEFLQPSPKVSPEVALYGLVDTLTQFSAIKQVQIRIEGKSLTKYGTIDATKLVNKISLVKEAPANNPTVTNSDLEKTPEVSTPAKTSHETLPNSPSSINLFNYPSSST